MRDQIDIIIKNIELFLPKMLFLPKSVGCFTSRNKCCISCTWFRKVEVIFSKSWFINVKSISNLFYQWIIIIACIDVSLEWIWEVRLTVFLINALAWEIPPAMQIWYSSFIVHNFQDHCWISPMGKMVLHY